MTAEKTPGSGAGALVGGGTALALVLVAMGWWVARDPGTTAEKSDPVAEAPVAQNTDQIAPEQPAAEAAPTSTAPRFDVVRVEPDGSAVIAGQAQPGAQVQLLLDGQDAGLAQADDNGNFVALLTLPPSDAPRVMELMVDGEKIETADQSVIVGPIVTPDPAPAQVELAEATVADAAGEILAVDTTADSAPESGSAEVAATDAPAPTAPQVLLADEQGIKVLQDTGGAVTRAEVQLDSIAYDALGAVILAGRGAANAAVQIYLDGAELVRTVADEDGQWRLELPPVAAGVYDLGVELRDGNGAVISRVDTPFKREDPAKIAALETAVEAVEEAIEDNIPGAAEDDTSGQVAETPATTETPVAAPAPITAPAAEVAPEGETTVARAADAPEPQPQTAEAVEQVAELGAEQGAAEAPRPAAAAQAENVVTDEAPADVDAQPARPKLITVQPGSTLWAIARDTLGEGTLYVQVFDANRAKIRNPDLIYPGQVFTVPVAN